jgi:multiple antibiotic resistance protein
MYHSFVASFIPIFVAIDAPGIVPVFIALTEGMTQKRRREIIFEAVAFALVITLGFMFLGETTFHYLSITESDFRVAGGVILLALTMIDLLTPTKTPPPDQRNVGVFPLAMPIIAGPATLTTALVLAGRGDGAYALTSVSVGLNFLILLLALLTATQLSAWIGINLLRAFSKIVMVFLAAIAVNLIHTGLAHMWAELTPRK